MGDTYLFYLDESGQREGKDTGYFVLCALGIRVRDWHALDSQITEMKWTYFNNPNVEMKSTWLRVQREREKRYITAHNITEGDLRQFTHDVYDAIAASEVLLIASVIDRRRFVERRSEGDTVLSLAYKMLFERIERCLQKINGFGILIFDKIEDAEMKRAGYEKLLAEQHRMHRQEGTEFVKTNRIVENLLFIRSSDNNGIQLADLCAYNVMRQFRDYGERFHDRKGFVDEDRYEYSARIEAKFFRMDGRYIKHALRRLPSYRADEWEKIGGRRSVLAADTEGHRDREIPPTLL